ncbi:flavodoxin [Fusobacterium sp. PH5-44]|uniref:flavodoxin n=1 Tax=unclassified Fusobacterium TaxID=2648384 RepID=UPI003D1FEBCB
MNNNKILIVYFSKTGKTEIIAKEIQEFTKGDIFKIEPIIPYPNSYLLAVWRGRKELKSNTLPEIKLNTINTNTYNTIFLGFPIWWGTMPKVMDTFIKENELKGKLIIPFATHGGGGSARSIDDIIKLIPDSTIEKEAFTTKKPDTNETKEELRLWINKLLKK